ncbi:MAG TPA: hypothetical protein VFZ01_16925 [Geminicoccaceae bacterium]
MSIFDQGRSAEADLHRAAGERLRRAAAARRAIAARQRTATLIPWLLLSLLALGPLVAGSVDWLSLAVQISRLLVLQ